MKTFLSLFFLIGGLALSAETSVDFSSKKDLQFIFEKDFLNAADSEEMLYLQAARLIEKNKSSLTPDQLIKQFKILALKPEIQQRYQSIYASLFTTEELEKSF